MRRSVSKKLRFDIFKRDGFACQYCGQKPPSVVLELDHVVPVSSGGGNDEDNLLTSCFDCNRGKGAGDLAQVPPSVDVRLAELQERELQLRELRKWKAAAKRRRDKEIAAIQQHMSDIAGLVFTDTFVRRSLNPFLDKLDADTIHDILDRVAAKRDSGSIGSVDHFCRYFCWMCWKTIKGEL